MAGGAAALRRGGSVGQADDGKADRVAVTPPRSGSAARPSAQRLLRILTPIVVLIERHLRD
jgi:hypothetical protein